MTYHTPPEDLAEFLTTKAMPVVRLCIEEAVKRHLSRIPDPHLRMCDVGRCQTLRRYQATVETPHELMGLKRLNDEELDCVNIRVGHAMSQIT